ncbi:pyridoxine/pyridoxamine 5'-phosphate oxidase [Pseudophaeobacter sp.]|uniref:pyridoxine/pyridoxamine 5'-phosphate oxidase n=1 Tax=Pseudophaeobacter sp. TaxID=1971739 RepID=UPI0040582F5B
MDPETIRTRVRLRREGIDLAALGDDPMHGFSNWRSEASQSAGASPMSCSMATADSAGRPWIRQMDLVTVDHGFVFLTHGGSRKMQELEQTGQAALGFSWSQIGRQVTVRGQLEQLQPEQSDAMFQRMPRGIQLVAVTTRQDQILEARAPMEAAFMLRKSELGEAPIPRPAQWLAFRIVPLEVEFWQQRLQDLQDRIRFLRDTTDDPWEQQRLSP